ncbi:MAG: aminoglycoside 3'-phosphotransferase [Ruminococcaceae bacterium]|nr:aminoglycoside 3'-phosphotransferase [Oscillospiraceae bacterium]
MKRTEIAFLESVPRDLKPFVTDARIFDSSCSPEARVWFLDRDGGYYLKRSKKGTLAKEALMDAYFHQKGLGAEVLCYRSEEENDWLLTARVAGEDCTCARYLEDPTRLCDTIALRLRALHELVADDCPVQDRMVGYCATVAENYQKQSYDLSYASGAGFSDAEDAYRFFERERASLDGRVLLHGDYCLPNIMLDDWAFSGFIDLGNGGVGDRHIDLFWGAWTLAFNLGTDRYRSRFFDAYGRDFVEEEKIRVVAAAEVFG